MPPYPRRQRKLQGRIRTTTSASTTVSPRPTRATGTLTPLTFGTSGKLELSPTTSTSTLHRPPHSTTALTTSSPSSTAIWADHLPDLPQATVLVLAGSLSFLFITAVCLFMINFYPQRPRAAPAREGGVEVKQRGYYREVPQVEDAEFDGAFCSSRMPDWQGSWPNYEGVGAGGSAQVEEGRRRGLPMSVRRRRGRGKPGCLSVDTTGKYRGLGIAVPGEGVAVLGLSRRVSYSEGVTSLSSTSDSEQKRATNWTPLPSPLLAAESSMGTRDRLEAYAETTAPSRPSSTELKLIETSPSQPKPQQLHNVAEPKISLPSPINDHPNRTATIPASDAEYHSNLLQHHQNRLSDLEAGFLTAPSANAHLSPQDPTRESPYASPHGSPSSSHSSSSTLTLLLQKGEDAIDFAARSLVRIVYDRVNRDDVEGRLLLPVRSCEREGFGGEGECD